MVKLLLKVRGVGLYGGQVSGKKIKVMIQVYNNENNLIHCDIHH